MIFAERLNSVKPSATLAIAAKSLELKAKGIPIISLALGEPDFNTPDHIAKAAIKAIEDKHTRYTAANGIPEARKAVCTYFKREYNADLETENVIITNGGKQALFNLLMVLCSDGDEVLVPAPYWTSYPEMVSLAAAKPVIVQTKAEDGFRLKIEDLEKEYTKKCKVLLLNSPSNPTGVTYTQEELDNFAKWAIEHNLFIISDEIYDQLIYPPSTKASLIHLIKKYPENIAICNGVAKSFAMTGWRLGYVVAAPQIIKHCTTMQGQATSNVCSIAQYALIEALTASYDCIKPMKEAFMRRLDFAHKEIASWEGIICPKPEGAFYLFPDMSAILKKRNCTGDELCAQILEHASVAIVPGSAFGNPNCVRLSYALSDEDLQKALTAIKNYIYS